MSLFDTLPLRLVLEDFSAYSFFCTNYFWPELSSLRWLLLFQDNQLLGTDSAIPLGDFHKVGSVDKTTKFHSLRRNSIGFVNNPAVGGYDGEFFNIRLFQKKSFARRIWVDHKLGGTVEMHVFNAAVCKGGVFIDHFQTVVIDAGSWR